MRPRYKQCQLAGHAWESDNIWVLRRDPEVGRIAVRHRICRRCGKEERCLDRD